MAHAKIRHAAAMVFIAGTLLWGTPRFLPSPPYSLLSGLVDFPDDAEFGEALVHGLDRESFPSISYHLPMRGILSALLFSHASPAWHPLWRWAYRAAFLALLCAVALALGPPELACLAAAGLIWIGPAMHDGRNYVHSYYTLFVLLAAAALAWRARKPTLRRTLALGLAIDVSLLYRSPLAFFPPFLIAVESLSRRGLGWRRHWKHAAILLGVSYLPLVPWVWLNKAVYHELVVFERHEADPNIVTGAMGLVLTSDGDWRWQDLYSEKSAGTLSWAVQEVARHPLRYARGVGSRIAYVILLHPWLFLLAAAALIIYRRDPVFRAVGLLAAYYLAIHCTMTVQEGYFKPLWPILTVLAAAAFLRLGFVRFGPTDRESGFPATAVVVCLAAAWSLGLYTEFVLVRYTLRTRQRPPHSPEALEIAIRDAPSDSWLRAERGRRRLRAGDYQGAVADLSEFAARYGGHTFIRAQLAWARMNLGSPSDLLAMPIDPAGHGAVEAGALKAHGYYRLGRIAECRAELRDTLERDLEKGAPDRVKGTPLLTEWRRSRLHEHMRRTGELLRTRPEGECLALLRHMGSLAGAAAEEEACLEPRRQLAIDLQNAGRYPEAIELLGSLIRRRPKAVYFNDRGVCRFLAGDAAGGLDDMRRALIRNPDLAEASLSLGTALTRLRREAEARKVFGTALARPETASSHLTALIRESLEQLGRGAAGTKP